MSEHTLRSGSARRSAEPRRRPVGAERRRGRTSGHQPPPARYAALLPEPLFQVRCARAGTITLLAFCGELDLDGAPVALSAVEATLALAGAVIIDLGPLRFIDAAGLRVLVSAHQRLGERLTLQPGGGIVAKVLALTGLADSLPFVTPGSTRDRRNYPKSDG